MRQSAHEVTRCTRAAFAAAAATRRRRRSHSPPLTSTSASAGSHGARAHRTSKHQAASFIPLAAAPKSTFQHEPVRGRGGGGGGACRCLPCSCHRRACAVVACGCNFAPWGRRWRFCRYAGLRQRILRRRIVRPPPPFALVVRVRGAACACLHTRTRVHANASCNLVHMYEDDLGWTLDYDASIMAGGGDFTKAFHAAQTGQRYNR